MRNIWQVVLIGILMAAPAAAESQSSSHPKNHAPGTRFRDCSDCPEMVVLPAGRFTMGSAASEMGRFANEGPEHPVEIPHAFAVGVYDVTRKEFEQFARATKRPAGDSCLAYDGKGLPDTPGKTWRDPGFPQTDRDPVVCVTWQDATDFVAWLNQRVDKSHTAGEGGHPYRLLTEAEWEYAARAGTTSAYYWGDQMLREHANYGPNEMRFAPTIEGKDLWGYTSPVGSFPANGFGLFDMAGNVWQWTADCWHDSYAEAPLDGSAWTSGACEARVVRGGSWFKPAAGERSAKRGIVKPEVRNGEIGFRVARTLD
jgi:formylglycine-generating enzyme